jgi:hypothetical protein
VTAQHGAWAPEVSFVERYAKAILAGLFSLSPAVVVGVLTLFGVHIDAGVVAALLGVLGPLLGVAGVAVGPANKSALTPLVSLGTTETLVDSVQPPAPTTEA